MTSHVTGQSLGASVSFRSSYSSKGKTDRILEQLKQDSDDIEKALEFYLAQREEINEKNSLALRAYEVEIEEIGDVSDVDDEEFHEDSELEHIMPGRAPSGGVDHNLRRHLGTGDDVGEVDSYEEYANDFDEDDFANVFAQEGSQTLNKKSVVSSGLPTIEYVKPKVPSLEVKEAIRNKLFSFLDENRDEEESLEARIAQMKAMVQERIHEMTDEEIVQSEVRQNAIEESLFQVQKKNHQKLLDIMKDYQPTLSGKLWGNDPEYRKTMKELKKRLHS